MGSLERTIGVANAVELGWLSPELTERNWLDRMTGLDESEMALCVFTAWRTTMERLRGREGIVMPLADLVQIGEYSPGVPALNWSDRGYSLIEKMRQREQVLYGMMRAQTILQSVNVGAIVEGTGVDVVLATGDISEQKSDRETINRRRSPLVEIPMVRTGVGLVCKPRVRALIVVDSHSVNTIRVALEHGVAAADLTAIPAMVDTARNKGLLNGKLINLVLDTGAMNRGCYLGEVIDCVGGVQTKKNLTENTKVLLPTSDKDWEGVEGMGVVTADDRFMTGKTGLDPARKALENGAARVVLMITHPEFVDKALKYFNELSEQYPGKLFMVTTDLHIPVNPENAEGIKKTPNIYIVPLQEKLINVLELVAQGIDIYSNAGRKELQNLGWDLAPWQLYHLGAT